MAQVFGAINRFISRLDSDQNISTHTNGSNASAFGFQILQNNNPESDIEPWFDFIIGVNGRTIDNPSPDLFKTELQNCAGRTISFGIYSAKGQQIRETYVTIPSDSSTLGLSLQWTPLTASSDVWHILDVIPNSPADVAGLLPYSDYVIGTPESVVRGEAGLGEIIEEYMGRPLRLWVYNNEYNVTRMVTITPAKNWGGDGALGCVLGYGALHRLPAPLLEPAQAPGETLFDGGEPSAVEAAPNNDADGSSFLVPANMAVTSPSKIGPPASKSRKARTNAKSTTGLDDYFQEGEQNSRELDNAPTSKAGDALPPPPPPPKATT